MQARIHILTLGVKNLEKAAVFYEKLLKLL
ncbi:MAG: hypothetical protein LDLANPLL_01025 [Turneriella sp.]|nr:hypothetical protein [Turneriella sp.]